MKGSSRGSQSGSNRKTKRYVKNKLQIGDSRPNIMTKPEGRSTQMRLTAGTAAAANHLIDQTAPGQKEIKMQDGSKFKKEVRARSPQAITAYGSKKKAMKNSYEKTVRDPTKLKGTNTKKTRADAAAKEGGLKKRSSRPRKNKGLI